MSLMGLLYLKLLHWGAGMVCGTWGVQEERNMVGVAATYPEHMDGRLILVVVRWAVASFVYLGWLLPLDRERQKGEYERIGFGQ